MSGRIEQLLTQGLEEGYAGTKKADRVRRAGFLGRSNDYTSTPGGHYHDEWFANDNGGGQELVEIDGERATRLYAGGVISVDDLTQLGLTARDVISHLITSVRTLGDKTRLYTSCSLDLPGGWQYKYTILKTSDEIPLTIAYESIDFRGREVFAHGHLISPIK